MIPLRWRRVPLFLFRIARFSRHPLNALRGIWTILALPDKVRYQPEFVKIETTTRCNLACQFCGRTLGTQRESEMPDADVETCRSAEQNMSVAAFRAILDQLPCAVRLDVQGMGEPLMNPEFLAILDVCAKQKVRTQFYTNGTLLTADVAKRLVELRVGEITFSLDGASARTYEHIRRGASFTSVTANIRGLVEARQQAGSSLPYIRIAMVATALNVAEMPELVALGHKLGADEVVVTYFKEIAPSLSSWRCDPAHLLAAVQASRQVAKTLGIRFAVEFGLPEDDCKKQKAPTSRDACLWPWLSLNISIDGDLSPCCYVPCAAEFGLGNILQDTFESAWNGPSYQHLRQSMRTGHLKGLPCHMCRDKV